MLICDEVICAFGRLGHWFAYERFGIKPDLVTFAKAITSGYVPLGGVLINERLATLADHALVGVAESCGMVAGLILVRDKATLEPFADEWQVGLRCRQHCFDTGVVMRAVGARWMPRGRICNAKGSSRANPVLQCPAVLFSGVGWAKVRTGLLHGDTGLRPIFPWLSTGVWT